MLWTFGLNRKQRRWQCKRLRSSQRVTDRQERIKGWKQSAATTARLLLAGGGALNGLIGWGLVRKGYGRIDICDKDIVEPTNLNRQFLFKRDLFKNKAACLCRNLAKHGFAGTELVAHPCWAQELSFDELQPTVVICSVDMQVPGTRLEISRLCYQRRIPCVFAALSVDADLGYVFIQKPGGACWACALRPEQTSMEDVSVQERCPGVPASVDVVMAVAGHALYAIDTLLMARPCDWNYRILSMSRSDFGGSVLVQSRSDCPVCGESPADDDTAEQMPLAPLERGKAASGVS